MSGNGGLTPFPMPFPMTPFPSFRSLGRRSERRQNAAHHDGVPLMRPTAMPFSTRAQAIGPVPISSAQPWASSLAPSKPQCRRGLPRTAPNTSACPVANSIAAQT